MHKSAIASLFSTLMLTWQFALGQAPPVAALAVAPDGQSVISCSQAGIRIHAWPSLQVVRSVQAEFQNLHHISFSDSGDRFAVAGGDPAERGGVEVFRWPEIERIAICPDHDDSAMQAVWLDRERLASCSLDRSIIISDASTGDVVSRLKGHSRGVLSLCHLPDQELLVSGGIDQSLRVWDWQNKRQVRSLSNHKHRVLDVERRPGHDRLSMVASVSEDKTLRLWQPSIGRLVRFARLPAIPMDCCWRPDGQRVYVCCDDGVIYTIDPENVTLVDQESRTAFAKWTFCLCMHSDGSLIVGGQNGQITRIDSDLTN